MGDPKTIDIESLRPAISELERALTWTFDDLLDASSLPRPVVVAIQTVGKKARCRGWYKPESWSSREGESRDEITIAAEHLKLDVPDLIGVVIHEAVHVFNNAMSIKDTNDAGRHNKKFRDQAESVGLECEAPHDSYGYGYTKPSEELRRSIESGLRPDYTAFNIFRLPTRVKTVVTNTRAWGCTCPKPLKVRTTRTDVSIHCKVCDTDYIQLTD